MAASDGRFAAQSGHSPHAGLIPLGADCGHPTAASPVAETKPDILGEANYWDLGLLDGLEGTCQ
jgi:hypothetical protein